MSGQSGVAGLTDYNKWDKIASAQGQLHTTVHSCTQRNVGPLLPSLASGAPRRRTPVVGPPSRTRSLTIEPRQVRGWALAILR